MSVKIIIVDDHEIVRQGIRLLLRQVRPEWIVVGEATTGQEAIDLVKVLNPDIAILDITMPGLNGLEAVTRMRKSGVKSRVLMFTMHESEMLNREAKMAGAQGLVSKSQAARDLILAIETILGGGTFFGEAVKSGEQAEEPSGGALLFARTLFAI